MTEWQSCHIWASFILFGSALNIWAQKVHFFLKKKSMHTMLPFFSTSLPPTPFQFFFVLSTDPEARITMAVLYEMHHYFYCWNISFGHSMSKHRLLIMNSPGLCSWLLVIMTEQNPEQLLLDSIIIYMHIAHWVQSGVIPKAFAFV